MPGHEELERLFHLLADLGPEERAGLLARESPSPELRARLEELLALDAAQTGDLLASPPVPELRHECQPEFQPGDVFDGYRILEHMGGGGMGEVYLALQESPIRREVALKVIRRGMETEQVAARFALERQALAAMDHSAVARVYSAGATPGGRPYFAMEVVRGLPITEHCRRERLGTRARIALFLQVCDGVQHAHQKAIIHRDLKPSNVLVTLQDGAALPKIIDFGVAKSAEQNFIEQALQTEFGMMIGTPEYMSPEQAGVTGEDVDTRTDVYSLGVILYELLTGVLPFDPKELRRQGFQSVQRILREREAPRPSTRITADDGKRPRSGATRPSEPLGALRRALAGDLDWITLRALEKDRTRRYGSPAELAADLRRHLADEPVLAGPPGAAYRAGKFIRRHRLGVSLAAVGVAVLLSFSAVLAVSAQRIAAQRDRADAAAAQARREAATAERVTGFMVDLFAHSDPAFSRGAELTVREMLDAGARRVVDELGDEPEVQARLLAAIGDSYRGLGSWEEAVPLLEQSLRQVVGAYGEASLEAARAQVLLAYPLVHLGEFDRAETLNRQALATLRERLPEGDPALGEPINYLAFGMLRQFVRPQEAEALLRETLPAQRAVGDPRQSYLIQTLDHLGWALLHQGRSAEAEIVLREALEAQRSVDAGDLPRTGYMLQRLAAALRNQGRHEEALAATSESLEMARRLYGDDHPEMGYIAREMSRALVGVGDFAAAVEWSARSVANGRRTMNDENPELAQFLLAHGRALWANRQLAEADQALSEAAGIQRRALGPVNGWLANSLRLRADVARRRGQFELARALIGEAIDIREQLASGTAARQVDAIVLAQVLADTGEIDAACAEADAALEGLLETVGQHSPDTALARSASGRCRALRGDLESALPLLQAGYAGLEAAYPPGEPRREEALAYLQAAGR